MAAEVEARLTEGTLRMQSSRAGKIQGILLAGAMLYAARLEAKDTRRKENIKFLTKVVTDIGVAGGLGASIVGIPAIAVVGPIANAIADKAGGSIADALIPTREWVTSLRTAVNGVDVEQLAAAAEEGNKEAREFYLRGFKLSVNFLETAFGVYEKRFPDNSKLAKAARENPRLLGFLDAVFDHRVVPKFIRNATVGYSREP